MGFAPWTPAKFSALGGCRRGSAPWWGPGAEPLAFLHPTRTASLARRAALAHLSTIDWRSGAGMDGGADARRITIHAPEDFAGMRAAGRLAALTLDMITAHVRPGVTTGVLDELCHRFITGHDAVPAPLNYRGFPKSICT